MTDLALFTCERVNARLTTKGCANLWTKAQDPDDKPKPWEPRAHCQFCPIGAGHAGKSVAPMAEVVADLKPFCPRCEQFGRRMIGGRFCVSCYNRDREARIGTNRKGTAPKKTSSETLHSQVVAITTASGTDAKHHHAEMVMSRTEAIIAAARNAKSPMAFGLPPIASEAWMIAAAGVMN